jgi:hypothetical protein
MAKVKLTHTRLGTAEYIVRMKEIDTSLTGNAVFAALAAKRAAFLLKVQVLEAKNTAYEAQVNLARTGLTERNAARREVEAAARALANASEGETTDAAELLGGGWHLRGSSTAPVGPMPAPQDLNSTGGHLEGESDVYWKPVKGRETYIGEHSESPTGPWIQFYIGKKARATASGLTSGSFNYFRIRASGANGRGPWSDIKRSRAT